MRKKRHTYRPYVLLESFYAMHSDNKPQFQSAEPSAEGYSPVLSDNFKKVVLLLADVMRLN